MNPEVKAYKHVRLTRSFLEDIHYAEHKGKDFFGFLIDYISVNHVAVVIIKGAGLASQVRELLGPTKPEEATLESPMSLRSRYGIIGGINCAHASENAERGAEEASNFERRLGLVADSKAKESLERYIDTYIDWPYVDSIRYREVSFALTRKEIEPKEARAKFLDYLGKESTLHSRMDLERMVDVMVRNCVRNVPVVSSPFLSINRGTITN